MVLATLVLFSVSEARKSVPESHARLLRSSYFGKCPRSAMDLRRLKLSSICHRSRYISRTLSVLACSTLRVVNTSTYWAQGRVSGPTGLPRCCLSFRRKSARRMASLLLRIAVSRPGIFRSPTWIHVGHSATSPVLPTALSSADNLKRLPSLLYKGKACGLRRTQTSACCSTMARIPGGLLYPASASTRSFFEKTNCPNRSATPAPAVDVRTKWSHSNLGRTRL